MRWFVFSPDAPPFVQSKRIRTGTRLTLEPLEERRCLAADLEFAASNCLQLPGAENELSQFESAESAAPYHQETLSLPNESCADNLEDIGHREDEDGTSNATTRDDDVIHPEDGDEPPDIQVGSLPLDTDFAVDTTNGIDSPANLLANSPKETRTDQNSNVGTVTGPAVIASPSQQLNDNRLDSTTPQERKSVVVPVPASTIEPNPDTKAPRPLIQQVESLRVLPVAPINAGQLNAQIVPAASYFGATTARVGLHGVGSEGGELIAPFAVEAAKAVANDRIRKTKYESARPSISAVTALMPASELPKTKQLAEKALQEDAQSEKLVSISGTQVSATFVPIEEEVAGAASGAILPEILGEQQEDRPAESINPLFFVVLVGLIGFPKPNRFRLIRKNGTRDNSPTPGPITVVPLVNELEPWPKTTLVKRTQDETI